jgi:hypothetical protein
MSQEPPEETGGGVEEAGAGVGGCVGGAMA